MQHNNKANAVPLPPDEVCNADPARARPDLKGGEGEVAGEDREIGGGQDREIGGGHGALLVAGEEGGEGRSVAGGGEEGGEEGV